MARLSSELILRLIDKVSGPAAGIGGRLRALNGQVDRMNRGHLAAMAPLRGFAGQLALYGAGYIGVTQGIQGTAGAAITLESALADVRKVVDVTDGQFANMKRDIVGLSREMPVTAEGFASIYAAAAQSNVAQNELKGFAEGVVRVSTAWDTAVDTTGESLAKIKTALGRDLKGTFALADAINHVSNVSAASAPNMLEYTNRVAAFAETAGFSAEQALAVGGAMVGSGFEPEVAATSFRNMSRALTMGARATKAQRVAFKALGLDATKTAKGMQKDAVKTTLDVLDRIKKLPEYEQLSIAGALFGEEARGLAPLIRDATELRRLLRETGDAAAYGGSAFKEYVARANTTANVLQILRNKIADSFRSWGDEMLPGIKEGATAFGDVLDTLGERAGILDKISASVQGFTKGLGYNGGIKEAVEGLGDLLFGKADGAGAADELGRLFAQAEGWGRSLAQLNKSIQDSPLAGFLGSLTGYGASLALTAIGIGLVGGAVRSLAAALYLLSGAKAAVGILKFLAKGGKWAAVATGLAGTAAEVADSVVPDGGKPRGTTPKPSSGGGGLFSSLIAAMPAMVAGAFAASMNLGQSDLLKTEWEKERDRYLKQRIRDRFQYPDATHSEERERDRSVDNWAQSPRPGGIHDVLNPRPTGAFQKMLDGMSRPQQGAAAGPPPDIVGQLRSTTLQTRQTGTASVHVENPPPPVMAPVTIVQHVTMEQAPAAAARAYADATGRAVQNAVHSSLNDGGV